ncbi:hypothetical protein EJB05_51036, partial [Eragrostis curvula]
MDFGEEEENGVWKGWSFSFPRPLFTSAVLQSLRLSHCRWTCRQPSCPRLADLTLESCSKLTRVSVRNKRLCRLALLCCHSVVSVSLDASELRFLHYRGAVTVGSLFAFHGFPGIHSGIIDFCGPKPVEREGPRRVPVAPGELQDRQAPAPQLRPAWLQRREQISHGFPSVPQPSKSSSSQDASIDSHSITRVLQQTPDLAVLSLFLVPDPEHTPVTIPDAPPPVLCL